MRAELAWREGDYTGVISQCETVLAAIAANEARWWQSLRAQVRARLALAALELGAPDRCRAQLSEALDLAATWWERPALALVLDACAVYVLRRGGAGDPGQAARLLGAAHAVRGAFDESSPDAPAARAAAGEALGPQAFAAAYDSARGVGYDDAVTLAREAL
jgi:hypothetical protein